MRAGTGRVGVGLCALVLLLAGGCSAADVISGSDKSASPSKGMTSLQTAPYDDAGAPTHVSPEPTPPSALAGDAPDFTSVAANFDPGRQRFVWVLPPGVHGVGPWGFTVEVRHRGEVKHEGQMPLVAEKIPAGSRPEYTAGYEIIRLTDDGKWAERTAELDTIIHGIIEQYGRGDGEVEFNSQLHVSLEPASETLYCEKGDVADIRLYMEEEGESELVTLVDRKNDVFSRMAVVQACKADAPN